ncbi:SDR family oxidoreductase [Candidatus Pelagibacter sp.]|nr:SDR family oxidoreductase [Candidatus Pelagibacter sp.]
MNKINLKKKIIIITGSNGVLGKFLAKSLKKLSKKLILIDKNEKNQNKFGDYYQCNFEFDSEIAKLIKFLKKKYKRIDAIINNAAMVGDNIKKNKFSVEEWQKCLNINLISIYQMSVGLESCLIKSSEPSIVNISSIYSVVGPDQEIYRNTLIFNPASYSASKGGLNSLTRWLAASLNKKIRVNSISLGGVLRKQSKTFIKRYSKKTIMKRMAKNQDIVGPVIFFISKDSSYITGQNLLVDGGYTAI